MYFIKIHYEDMKEKLKAAEKANSDLEKQNVGLQETYDVMLKSTRETELRLEIKLIPQDNNENVMNLMSSIGELVGESMAILYIDVCRRVPTKDPTKRNLIVQFQHTHRRDLILDETKKKRITTSDFGFDTATPVFVKECLCAPLKQQLGMTQARK